MYIVVDSSSAMEKGKDQAVSWLCTTVIDGIIADGDRLFIWTAGAKAELLYSGAVSAEAKDEAKKLIRGIRFSGARADYTGALSEASAKVLNGQEGRLQYTLLVSGADHSEAAGFLRYSKVENFSGWRVITVGLDVGARARRLAASYMRKK